MLDRKKAESCLLKMKQAKVNEMPVIRAMFTERNKIRDALIGSFLLNSAIYFVQTVPRPRPANTPKRPSVLMTIENSPLPFGPSSRAMYIAPAMVMSLVAMLETRDQKAPLAILAFTLGPFKAFFNRSIGVKMRRMILETKMTAFGLRQNPFRGVWHIVTVFQQASGTAIKV